MPKYLEWVNTAVGMTSWDRVKRLFKSLQE